MLIAAQSLIKKSASCLWAGAPKGLTRQIYPVEISFIYYAIYRWLIGLLEMLAWERRVYNLLYLVSFGFKHLYFDVKGGDSHPAFIEWGREYKVQLLHEMEMQQFEQSMVHYKHTRCSTGRRTNGSFWDKTPDKQRSSIAKSWSLSTFRWRLSILAVHLEPTKSGSTTSGNRVGLGLFIYASKPKI